MVTSFFVHIISEAVGATLTHITLGINLSHYLLTYCRVEPRSNKKIKLPHNVSLISGVCHWYWWKITLVKKIINAPCQK